MLATGREQASIFRYNPQRTIESSHLPCECCVVPSRWKTAGTTPPTLKSRSNILVTKNIRFKTLSLSTRGVNRTWPAPSDPILNNRPLTSANTIRLWAHLKDRSQKRRRNCLMKAVVVCLIFQFSGQSKTKVWMPTLQSMMIKNSTTSQSISNQIKTLTYLNQAQLI